MLDPTEVTRWKCPYCQRHYASPRGARSHARHCWKNPQRLPRLGEISCLRTEPYGDEAEWWPGFGMIYTSDGWLPVPGYELDREDGTETWPDCQYQTAVDDFEYEPLNNVARTERLEFWPSLLAYGLKTLRLTQAEDGRYERTDSEEWRRLEQANRQRCRLGLQWLSLADLDEGSL